MSRGAFQQLAERLVRYKASMVFIAHPSPQAIASFTNQALRGVPQNFSVEQLEKYRAVTKDDVLAALKKHVLPVFNSSSSIAVAVTSPTKTDAIAEGLTKAGFEVEQRTLEIDPSELEGSESGSEFESGSESDGR